MRKPEVSVVVAAYNTELYIGQCVKSILNQTFSDFELIVVDDGSDDRTADIIQEFIDQGEFRLRLVRNEHAGAGHSRNTGLDLAQGKYIIFLDADDFFEPDLLNDLYRSNVENNADISVCRAQSYDENSERFEDVWYGFRKDMIPEGVFSRKDVPLYILNMFMGWAWDKMYRTEFIRQNHIRYKNFRSSNDLYFVFMSLVKAERIKAVDRILVNYRISNAGSLHNTSQKAWDCFYIAALDFKDGLIKEGLYDEVKQSYLNWCADFFHSQIRDRACSDQAKLAYELVKEGLNEVGFFEMEEDMYFYKEAYQFMNMMKDSSYYDFVNQRYEKVISERNQLRDEVSRQKAVIEAQERRLNDSLLHKAGRKIRKMIR